MRLWRRRRRPACPAREAKASSEAHEALARSRQAARASEQRTRDVAALVRRVVTWSEEDRLEEAFERAVREAGWHERGSG